MLHSSLQRYEVTIKIEVNKERTIFVRLDLREDIVRVQFKHDVIHRVFTAVATDTDGAEADIGDSHVDSFVSTSGLKSA